MECANTNLDLDKFIFAQANDFQISTNCEVICVKRGD